MNRYYRNNKLSNELKTENETPNERTTVSLSRKNFLILKKIGYASESDSMNETITKILAHQQGAYKIKIQEEGIER